MKDVLAVVLAGGKGTRLEPLTRDRAKPAVPFGGCYRIIDFTLSNCLNSGLRRLLVLTQYKAMSLDRHITLGWRGYFCRELGEFVDVVPPQQRIDEQWYQGTADAVYQNIYAMEKERPEHVVILAGDHIYKMDYSKLVGYHKEKGADLTIAALTVSREEAQAFGVMQVDDQNRVVGFEEKPAEPKTVPGSDDECLASMGIYVFNAAFLFDELCRDATLPSSSHDFGKNIIPSIIDSRRVVAFPFQDENAKKQAYWRDVGTIDAYYEANLELTNVEPQLNLYDDRWPVRTYQPNLPPAKTVFADDGGAGGDSGGPRKGEALDSLVSHGAILSGGVAKKCVIGPGARINSYAQVEESILFSQVNIGRRCRIRRTIIDKDVHIPDGAEIGYDHEADRARGYTVTESGVVVVAKADAMIPSTG